jgi:hypothetical protein
MQVLEVSGAVRHIYIYVVRRQRVNKRTSIGQVDNVMFDWLTAVLIVSQVCWVVRLKL